MQTRLAAMDPNQSQADLPHSAQLEAFTGFNHLFEEATVLHPASFTDTLWKRVDRIYNEARNCHDNHFDDSGWMIVVNRVLASAGLDDDTSMLRAHSIQTQSIDPALLPQHPSVSFAKKSDVALMFNIDHPTVATAVKPVHRAHPSRALSQMMDGASGMVPMVSCVEVKEPGGNYNEAIAQVSIWCAAGLERLRGLRTLGGVEDDEQLPPFVGWTVVGHDWKFHVTWKGQDGNVVSSRSSLLCSLFI